MIEEEEEEEEEEDESNCRLVSKDLYNSYSHARPNTHHLERNLQAVEELRLRSSLKKG